MIASRSVLTIFALKLTVLAVMTLNLCIFKSNDEKSNLIAFPEAELAREAIRTLTFAFSVAFTAVLTQTFFGA